MRQTSTGRWMPIRDDTRLPRPMDLIECEKCHRVQRHRDMLPAARPGPFGPEPVPGFVCADAGTCDAVAYSVFLIQHYRDA